MTGIRIRNDRPEIVNRWSELLPRRHRGVPRPLLLAVVEQLSGEKLGDLVGYGVGGVVWTGISSGQRTPLLLAEKKRTFRESDGSPARSGPASSELLAVDEHCQPDTYTVSRYFAIWVICTGSKL